MSGSPYTFPNANIDLQDDSAPTVPDPSNVPVHLPLMLGFAEKGTPNVPVLGGGNALITAFGAKMLNERSAYFKHPNVFLKRALPYQQVLFARLVDPAAEAASLVLTCTVTPGNIVQYLRTGSGALVLTNGQPTPILNNGTPVTEAGITLSYAIRPLAEGETISTVANVTNGPATTYPLMAFSGTVGSAGNLTGFRLFYNNSYDVSAVANTGAMLWSFQPVVLNDSTNIETPVLDIYNSQTQTFAFMPGAYDPTRAMHYNLADVINNDYFDLPGLPYSFYVYGANVGTIGTAILGVSPELGAISPYLINIMTAVDAGGNPYEHMTVDSSAAHILNANVVNYLTGGTDGDMSDTMLNGLVTEYLAGLTYPMISDSFRYPCTHFYDSGFPLATKEDIMSLYSIRDNMKISFTTQDVSLPPNTAAEDQSTGSALRAMLLLNPESAEFGTQFCRADIYQQCGLLADTQVYNKIVPASLDRMLKRCAFNGGEFITGEPKGRPNSEVTIFNLLSLNWTPTGPQQKQLSWNTGLNYMQYCDTAKVFYPDLLSVYPITNSLLSSDCFVDYAAVYLKKIIRQEWTVFSGTTTPPATLYKDIAKAIDTKAAFVFNGAITTKTVVSQTAVDTALGYQVTVTTTVYGNMPNRVWNVVVPIRRSTDNTSS